MARPEASEKMPGAAASTGTVSVLPAEPFTLTITSAFPGNVSQGTWKLTWVEVTARIGAWRPFTVIETSASVLGSGALAMVTDAPKCVPNKVASEPGEIRGV